MKTNRTSGFTLVEILIAMALGSLVLAAVMSTLLFVARSTRRASNYNVMEIETARSLERMAREIRMGLDVEGTVKTSGQAYELSKVAVRVPDPDEELNPHLPSSGAEKTYWVEFYFRNETSGSVSLVRRRRDTGREEVLVRNVDPTKTYQFVRYDRAPGHAINDYSTNQIQLSMTLQPNDRGLVAATSERVVSASFVLRNR